MSYLILLLHIFLESLKMIVGAVFLMKSETTKKCLRWIIAVALLFSAPLLNKVLHNGDIVFFVGIVEFFLIICSENKFWRYLYAMLLVQLSDNLVKIAEIGITGTYHDSYKNLSDDLYVGIRNLLIFFLLCAIMKAFLKKYKIISLNVDLKSYVLLILFGIMIFFSVTGSGLIIADEANQKIKAAFAVSSGLLLIFVMFMFLFQSYLKEVGDSYKMLAEEQKESFKQQVEFYSEKKKSYDEIRNFRHDIKEHLTAAKGYISTGEYEKLETELDKMSKEAIIVEKLIDCGNTAVSALLTRYKTLSEKENIEFNCVGKIYGNIGLSDFDLVTVVGNLLKNAYEECCRLEKNRFIEVKIFCDESEVMIVIANSTSAENKQIDNLSMLKTLKQDSNDHGIGLKNIERVLKSNEKTKLEITIKDNIFSAFFTTIKC